MDIGVSIKNQRTGAVWAERVRRRIVVHRLDLALLLFLLLAVIKNLLFIERSLDIILWDESSMYLYTGVNLLKQGWPAAEWGPLYCAWYYFLSLFVKSNVQLYYLNFSLLIGLNTFLLFFSMRRIGCRPLLAFLAAIVFLSAGYRPDTLFDTTSVTQFALLLLLAAFLVGTYAESGEKLHYIIIVGALLAVFVRPELLLAFLVYCAVNIITIIVKFRKGAITARRFFGYLSITIVTVLVVFLVLGDPFASTGRSWVAFAQHFLMNQNIQHHTDVYYSDYERFAAATFGNAHSILEAARNNFPAFAANTFFNFRRYLVLSLTSVTVSSFSANPYYSDATLLAIGGVCYAPLLVFLFLKRRAFGRKFRNGTDARMLFFLFPLVLTAMFSSAIIYSCLRYVLIQKACVIMGLAYLAQKTFTAAKRKIKIRPLVQVLAGLSALILVPNITYGLSTALFRKPAEDLSRQYPLRTRRTVDFIKSLNITRPVNLLTSACYPIFIGDNYRWVKLWGKHEPFDEFVERNDINMILMDWSLEQAEQYRDDPEFKNFSVQYETHGFTRMKIPWTAEGASAENVYLLVKTDLTVP